MIRFLVASLALVLSSQAFAMPRWNGSYDCKFAGQEKGIGIVTFATQGDNLVLSGLDLGNSEANQGLPCANSAKESVTFGDTVMTKSSMCNDKGLMFTFTTKIGRHGADIMTQVSVTQVSSTVVQIGVFNTGTQTPKVHISNQTVLTCTKTTGI
ncbi:MAG: hypothetical protein ACXVA9_08725 [Bdellovibrionales bacterium]